MPFDLKLAYTRIIELTQDGLGPTKIEQAHFAATQLGKCLASSCADRKQVKAITHRLLGDYEDPELNAACKSPAYIVALCMMLATALEHFGAEQGRS